VDCSHGFRPGHSAHQALEQIEQGINDGLNAIYDADLKGYFDSIPHDKLMACVKMRIADRSVLRLIKMWLEAPVIEVKEGKKQPPKANTKGTPQGGVISPLLANIYLHWFDKLFHRHDGPAQWAKARLVRYADDLKGRGWKYLTLMPSKKALEKELEAIRKLTGPEHCFKPVKDMIETINEQTRGWKNYFSTGYLGRAFRDLNHFIRNRVIGHLQRRSQRGHKMPEGCSYYRYLMNLGLEPLGGGHK